MSTINDIAASVGFTKPAKRMLTRDEQVAKYNALAKQALLSMQHNAERSRSRLATAAQITPGTATYANLLLEAARFARAGEEAGRDAEVYLDRAYQANAADAATQFEDL